MLLQPRTPTFWWSLRSLSNNNAHRFPHPSSSSSTLTFLLQSNLRFLAHWTMIAMVSCHGWNGKLALGFHQHFRLGNLHMAGSPVSLFLECFDFIVLGWFFNVKFKLLHCFLLLGANFVRRKNFLLHVPRTQDADRLSSKNISKQPLRTFVTSTVPSGPSCPRLAIEHISSLHN